MNTKVLSKLNLDMSVVASTVALLLLCFRWNAMNGGHSGRSFIDAAAISFALSFLLFGTATIFGMIAPLRLQLRRPHRRVSGLVLIVLAPLMMAATYGLYDLCANGREIRDALQMLLSPNAARAVVVIYATALCAWVVDISVVFAVVLRAPRKRPHDGSQLAVDPFLPQTPASRAVALAMLPDVDTRPYWH